MCFAKNIRIRAERITQPTVVSISLQQPSPPSHLPSKPTKVNNNALEAITTDQVTTVVYGPRNTLVKNNAFMLHKMLLLRSICAT